MPLVLSGRSVHLACLARLPTLRRRCQTGTSQVQTECSSRDVAEKGFNSGVPRLYDDKLNVIIECSFQHGRSERHLELRSLARQLVNVHALSKNHPIPCNVAATGVDASLREACQRLSPGKWNINFYKDSMPALLPPHSSSKVIALSPDATNVLDRVQPGDVFLIGGIIDRTPHKYVSLLYAHEHGLKASKLPIQDNITVQGEGSMNAKWFLLNVDHVVHSLLEYVAHGDWRRAFDTVLPARKRTRR
eukprot:jgi/Ulvmu1/9653/UM054_0085.1